HDDRGARSHRLQSRHVEDRRPRSPGARARSSRVGAEENRSRPLRSAHACGDRRVRIGQALARRSRRRPHGSRRVMRPVRVLLSILAALATAAALPPAPGAQDKKITLGLTTRTGSNSLPFVIAEEKGFFKGEGLNAVVVVMQNQVVVTGVASKNVDYGGTFS